MYVLNEYVISIAVYEKIFYHKNRTEIFSDFHIHTLYGDLNFSYKNTIFHIYMCIFSLQQISVLVGAQEKKNK